MYSFSYLEPVYCSMSSSNCCFLTCIQVSQEAGQVVCYAHLLQNFPQFIVIHTVKGFGMVNKAEMDVFLELSCFINDPVDVGNLISVPLPFLFSFFFKFYFIFKLYNIVLVLPNIEMNPPQAFSKTSLNIWKFTVHVLLKPGLENFEHYFTSV